MGGDRQGNIVAYEVDCYGTPGIGSGAVVRFDMLPYVYNVPNVKRRHRVIRLNAGRARAMRAPGHPQNSVLTEWALDELAAALNVNPMDMRIRNLPANDANAVRTAPTSFAALRNTIYTQEIAIARRLSDWNRRWHRPGQGNGTVKTGMGMALHTWGGRGRANNDHTVTINRDGSVLVQAATQDLGTGQRTVEAIVAAEILGLQPTQITVEIGESQHGRATGSGGSTTCPGTAPAVLVAAQQARDAMFQQIANGLGVQANNLTIQPGRIVDSTNNNNSLDMATSMCATWSKSCCRSWQLGTWLNRSRCRRCADCRSRSRYRNRRGALYEFRGGARLRYDHQQTGLRIASRWWGDYGYQLRFV